MEPNYLNFNIKTMKKIALILFSLITLTTYSQSTDSHNIDYYEYFDLYNTPNKEKLLIDSLSLRFNINIHTLELEPNSGYIKMIEIKNINSDYHVHGFNGMALEEDFRNGTLQCRIDINCKDATIFGN